MSRICLLLIFIFFSTIKPATAQTNETLKEQSCNRLITEANSKSLNVIENNQFNQTEILTKQSNAVNSKKVVINNIPNSATNENVAEKSQIAIAGFSLPSLWLAKEQFDPFGGKLISNWLTYPQLKQIDITVNWQLWTLLDYLGRYRFINQFGTVAREYGYNLRVFNQQQQCLALYEYNNQTNPPKWEIKIEGLGQDSLQVEPAE